MSKPAFSKFVFVDYDHPRCLTEALGAAGRISEMSPHCDRAGAADGARL